MSDAKIQWVATLSSGDTAVEHVGEYQVKPGERLPWVRLTKFAADNKLHLTSLRLNVDGRTIHMPRPNFGRFNLGEKSISPLFYSLQYMVEGEMGGEGTMEAKYFVDMCAHFATYDVHYIHDTSQGNSWIVVTDGFSPAAPSPLHVPEKTKEE